MLMSSVLTLHSTRKFTKHWGQRSKSLCSPMPVSLIHTTGRSSWVVWTLTRTRWIARSWCLRVAIWSFWTLNSKFTRCTRLQILCCQQRVNPTLHSRSKTARQWKWSWLTAKSRNSYLLMRTRLLRHKGSSKTCSSCLSTVRLVSTIEPIIIQS